MKCIIKVTGYEPMNFTLDEKNAPISVANFAKLAKSGYYTGLIFHRVIPGFMVQGGGMKEDMRPAASLKPIKGEFAANGVQNNLRHTAGVLSMARTMVPDSATSQFFICVADTPHLDGQYAAFGYADDRATIDTAIAISKVRTGNRGMHQNVPTQPIVIEKVEIID